MSDLTAISHWECCNCGRTWDHEPEEVETLFCRSNGGKACAEYAYTWASRVQDLERRLKSAHEYATLIVKQRNDAQEQLATERARAEAAEAELAAERARNQPLRARIKALQDQHDQDTKRLEKDLARYRAIWAEADKRLGEDKDGYWWHPSEFQKAVYGILQERAEAAEGREARLRGSTEAIEAWAVHVISIVRDGRVPSPDVVTDGEAIIDLLRAALAGTPETRTHEDGCILGADHSLDCQTVSDFAVCTKHADCRRAGTPEGEQ